MCARSPCVTFGLSRIRRRCCEQSHASCRPRRSCRRPALMVGNTAQRKTPAAGAGVAAKGGCARCYFARANLPRATFLNLPPSPFVWISLIMAA